MSGVTGLTDDFGRAITDETPWDNIGVSARVLNVFKRNELKTVGDVRKTGRWGLQCLQAFGPVCLKEVESVIGRIPETTSMSELRTASIRTFSTAELITEILRRVAPHAV